jgi:heme A synthase
MRKAYRIVAYLIAAEVVVQAMAMVFGIAGLDKWIAGGGVFDKAVMESDQAPFPELVGIIVHGINGSIVIPVLALVLLVCSFFAKIPRSVRWAALVLLLVVVQVNLGYAAPDLPVLGALHGLNALALFTTTLYTARRARAVTPDPVEQPVPQASTAV